MSPPTSSPDPADEPYWVAVRVAVPFARLGRDAVRLVNIRDPYIQEKIRHQRLVPLPRDQQPGEPPPADEAGRSGS